MIVADLTARHMSAAQIADELGVSRETVRRDLHNPPPAVEAVPVPDVAPDVAPRVAFGAQGLTLPASLRLGQDLRLLATVHKRSAEDVAEELIHQQAEKVRDRWRANMAAATEVSS